MDPLLCEMEWEKGASETSAANSGPTAPFVGVDAGTKGKIREHVK
jgi:hypothetical protein